MSLPEVPWRGVTDIDVAKLVIFDLESTPRERELAYRLYNHARECPGQLQENQARFHTGVSLA